MNRRGFRVIPAGMEDDEDECDSVLRTTQNLKITIVPNITIGAGVNGEDFDGRLPPDVEGAFKLVREMWNAYKKSPSVIQKLSTIYLNSENPLLLALQLFANCPGNVNIKNKTKNLALFVLETICELTKHHPQMKQLCTDNMRMVAFNFIKTSGVNQLYQAIVETYELRRIQPLFVNKIKEMIDEKLYKDAAYWTMYLDLTYVFTIFDIIIPLVLQDKPSVSDDYMDVAVQQQRETVEFFDSLLDKKKTVSQYCEPIIQQYKYTDVRHSKLNSKAIAKLITRLAKRYHIPSEITPNMNFSKSVSYMNYLLHKKYIEGGMSTDSWRELIRDTANTQNLQIELIYRLCQHADIPEAVFWSKFYNLQIKELPDSVQDEMRNNSSSVDSTDGDSSTATDNNFHKMNLSDEAIIVVDTNEKMTKMLQELSRHFIIGFDSEWKPSVHEESVSLVQIATNEKVYLIDVISNHISVENWKLLGRNIFNNLEILKIGFSLNNDMKMLHHTLPNLNISMQVTSCYLDLRDLLRKLNFMHGFKFPHKKVEATGESLSALAELCFGKKLDKSNQFSNWANRPLRKDQIKYAALDAFCLIEIYDVIAMELLRIGTDIETVVNEITAEKNFNTKSSKKSSKSDYITKIPKVPISSSSSSVNWQNGESSQKSIRVSEKKFICDEMLRGLVRELRKLGIDCIWIPEEDCPDSDACVKVALKENRCLLSRDSRYTRFSQYLPKELCVEVPAISTDVQIANIIKYFNICVTEEDIFSRCVMCNSNVFICASSSSVQLMKFGKVKNARRLYTQPNDNKRNCVLIPITKEMLRATQTSKGVHMNLDSIGEDLIMNNDYFYICDGCGKCYWYGTHLKHFMADKANIIAYKKSVP